MINEGAVLLMGMLFLILCSLFLGFLEILRKFCYRGPEKKEDPSAKREKFSRG